MATRTKARSAAFDYFILSNDGNYFICHCKKDDDAGEQFCGTKISSLTTTSSASKTPTNTGKTSNVKRHLQRFHPKIYEVVNNKDIQMTTSTRNMKCTVGQMSPLTSFFVSNKVTVTMNSEKFKKYIIEMVVKNSIPLSFFSKPAFLGMNGEMAAKLNVSLDRDNIRKIIIDEATHQKEELRKTLKGRFMFLKMDGCTRHRVNHFALNVRFISDSNKMVTQTLAVRDTHANHTSEYLAKLVESVLQDFEINKEQVLCIVTDNATNMLSTIDKINAATINNMSNEEDSSETDPLITIEDEFLDDMIEEASKLFPIQHMRCVVHTLQLAIRDGLKGRPAATMISRFRKVATSARTPKIDSIVRKHAGMGAILDQETRWGSTYMMIKRLLDLKPYLEDLANKDVSLTEYEWTQLTDLEALLRFPFSITKKFQAEDLTPGEFLLAWKELLYRLSQTGGLLAEGIVSSMKRREELLLGNTILLAAVYIDPMNRVLLNDDQIAKGKRTLYEIAIRMRGLASESENREAQNEDLIISSQSESSSAEEDFSKHLDRIERSTIKRIKMERKKPLDMEKSKFKEDFFIGLKEVEKYNRSSNLTITEVLPLYPQIIRNVARTITAMPPTQVSVERLFSALRIIKSDLRASMKEDLAEAVLFLRTKME